MSCPVCGSDREPFVLTGVRDRVTRETFRLLRCPRCGFARTDPVPPSLDRYYPERYRRYGGLSAAVLRSLYRGRVRSWLKDLPAGGRALELGSGTGWMLEALRGAGWHAAGTERTAAAAAIAAASGADVRVGGLEAFADDPAFDLVVMFHVLEHLADPMAALRAAHERLAPGGVLVLGLPNLASWQSRMTGRHWMHLDVPRHLVHFSPSSMRAALAAAGFRVERIGFRSFEHDPLGWVQSWLDALGFEQDVILGRLTGLRTGRGSPAATAAAFALAVPLGIVAWPLSFASWVFGAGAIMEVRAVREPTGASASGRR
jgi:SAM-dependent methyltransferase